MNKKEDGTKLDQNHTVEIQHIYKSTTTKALNIYRETPKLKSTPITCRQNGWSASLLSTTNEKVPICIFFKFIYIYIIILTILNSKSVVICNNKQNHYKKWTTHLFHTAWIFIFSSFDTKILTKNYHSITTIKWPHYTCTYIWSFMNQWKQMNSYVYDNT